MRDVELRARESSLGGSGCSVEGSVAKRVCRSRQGEVMHFFVRNAIMSVQTECGTAFFARMRELKRTATAIPSRVVCRVLLRVKWKRTWKVTRKPGFYVWALEILYDPK